MVSNCKLSKEGADIFSNLTLYRFVVGALQYTTLTRPEIAFVVIKVCQFMANPLDSHWVVVKRFLQYLKGTMFHGLHFQPTVLTNLVSLTAFCDADCASNADDRQFISGTAIFLGPNFDLLVVLQATNHCTIQY